MSRNFWLHLSSCVSTFRACSGTEDPPDHEHVFFYQAGATSFLALGTRLWASIHQEQVPLSRLWSKYRFSLHWDQTYNCNHRCYPIHQLLISRQNSKGHIDTALIFRTFPCNPIQSPIISDRIIDPRQCPFALCRPVDCSPVSP